MNLEGFITAHQALLYLATHAGITVSTTTWYRWLRSAEIPSTLFHGKIFVAPQALDDFIRKSSRDPADDQPGEAFEAEQIHRLTRTP